VLAGGGVVTGCWGVWALRDNVIIIIAPNDKMVFFMIIVFSTTDL
jgi:hypothetical protein